jgi:membrane protein
MLAVAMSVSSIFLKTKGEEQIKTFIEQFVANIVPAAPETNAPAAEDLFLTDDSATSTNAIAPIHDQRVQAAQQQAASYIHQFIQNTYSGTLGVTGMIFLLVTAILMLTRIEETFNDIWGVARGRNWLSRVVLYWAAITLVPLLLTAALGMSGGSHLEKTRAAISAVPFLDGVLAQALPVVIICFTFAMFYKLMPNTKVTFAAAFAGGALAGTAWHFYNLLTFVLAARAVSASKIYGGLALVPLLMGGLYMVWIIVLFGAQVAYAFQHRVAYLQEKLADNVNQRGREFVALRLMTHVGQRHQLGLLPPTVHELSAELAVPARLVRSILRTLLAARLVIEVAGGETGYAPARPLDAINCHHVLAAMRAADGQELLTRDEPVRAEVLGEFARIQDAERDAASTVTLLALVNRAQTKLELDAPPDARRI